MASVSRPAVISRSASAWPGSRRRSPSACRAVARIEARSGVIGEASGLALARPTSRPDPPVAATCQGSARGRRDGAAGRRDASGGRGAVPRRRRDGGTGDSGGTSGIAHHGVVSRRGLVLFAVMSILWGIPYLFIRIAVAEVAPSFLVLARTGLAAVILLPIALAGADLRPVLARWRWLLAFAAIEIALPWVMLGSAEQHLTSSLTGLLLAGVPLVGTVFALTTGGGDQVTRGSWLGLLVGLVGVGAIVGSNLGSSDLVAFGQVAVVVVCYAIGPAILARRLGGLSSVGVMALSLTLCALLYVPIAALQWPSAVPSTNVLGSIVILAVVCTAAAFLVFAGLIDEIGPVRATVITYVNPAVAALLGVLVLNETLTPPMVLGFGLVIAGSALATRRRSTRATRRRSTRATPTAVTPAVQATSRSSSPAAPIDSGVE